MPGVSIVMVHDKESNDRVNSMLQTLKISDVDIRIMPLDGINCGVYYYDASGQSAPLFDKLAVGGTFDR
jgi:hypothetical protein